MKIALALRKLGLRSDLLHSLGFASILSAISLWGKAATESDKHKKARAERLAIFVGLWPPTFFLLGKCSRTWSRLRRSRPSGLR